jgi:hypothetical protein
MTKLDSICDAVVLKPSRGRGGPHLIPQESRLRRGSERISISDRPEMDTCVTYGRISVQRLLESWRFSYRRRGFWPEESTKLTFSCVSHSIHWAGADSTIAVVSTFAAGLPFSGDTGYTPSAPNGRLQK